MYSGAWFDITWLGKLTSCFLNAHVSVRNDRVRLLPTLYVIP